MLRTGHVHVELNCRPLDDGGRGYFLTHGFRGTLVGVSREVLTNDVRDPGISLLHCVDSMLHTVVLML